MHIRITMENIQVLPMVAQVGEDLLLKIWEVLDTLKWEILKRVNMLLTMVSLLMKEINMLVLFGLEPIRLR